MNKQIIFGVVVVGIFLNVVPPLAIQKAVAVEDNPFSFHWWYKYPQKQVYDDDDKKQDKQKHKHKDVNKEERLDKKYCAGSGEWNGQRCVIDDPVEKAAYEDAVCDDATHGEYKNVCGGGGSDSSVSSETETKDNNDNKDDDNNNNDDGYPKIPQAIEKDGKFVGGVSDDEVFKTFDEYNKKVEKEKHAAEEHSFYDEAFDSSNDGHTDDDSDSDDNNNNNSKDDDGDKDSNDGNNDDGNNDNDNNDDKKKDDNDNK